MVLDRQMPNAGPRQATALKLAELQCLIDAGLASGVITRTPEQLRQLGRDRLAHLPAQGKA